MSNLGKTDKDAVIALLQAIVGRGPVPPPSAATRAQAEQPRGLLLAATHHVRDVLHNPIQIFAVDMGEEARIEFGIRGIFEKSSRSLRDVLDRSLPVDGKDGKDEIFY